MYFQYGSLDSSCRVNEPVFMWVQPQNMSIAMKTLKLPSPLVKGGCQNFLQGNSYTFLLVELYETLTLLMLTYLPSLKT